MSKKAVAAVGTIGLAMALAVLWRPTSGRRVRALENRANAAIASGEMLTSPAEVATLMHNRQIALAIFDLRSEAEYNRFHLIDARWAPSLAEVQSLPEASVKILVPGDMNEAFDFYRKLARTGVKKVYVMAGGVPAWLAIFDPPPSGGGLLAGALGDRHPASSPDLEHMVLPKFQPKVKLGAAGGKKPSGGCGG